MPVFNILPIPFFKPMLLCLSYLTDANTHPISSCIDAHCPFVFSVVSYFADTVCDTTNRIKAMSVFPIDSAAEHLLFTSNLLFFYLGNNAKSVGISFE